MTATASYGPIVNDIGHMGTTHQLIGGSGSARWKQLINGMHLTGPWNCVEYVTIPPGASCGEHTHRRTEEIYYILAGASTMHVDGERLDVAAGDVITCPIGTRHTIANHGDADMTFFVIEVYPGDDGAAPARRIALRDRLADADGFRDAAGPVRVASLDLGRLFSGPWRAFSVVQVAPGGSIGEHALPERDDVLFVIDGSATIAFGDETVEGGHGLCVGVPPGMPHAIANRSASAQLELLAAEVAAL